jgi:glucose-1-phosphate thymidylyltransferase
MRNDMEPIGIIPAAGFGARLSPYRFAKELLPIGLSTDGLAPGEAPRVRLVCEYALDCLMAASVRQALVVVADHKFEVMKCLSDGRDFSVELAYLHQRRIAGLPWAIDCGHAWTKDRLSALVLPDTIIEPRDCLRQLLAFRADKSAELALGVFPTPRPKDLCPVEFDADGRVLALYDKKSAAFAQNTWGIAAWTPRFAEFLHCFLARHEAQPGRELALADIIAAFLRAGENVRAMPVRDGAFWDIGTSASLAEAMDALRSKWTGK